MAYNHQQRVAQVSYCAGVAETLEDNNRAVKYMGEYYETLLDKELRYDPSNKDISDMYRMLGKYQESTDFATPASCVRELNQYIRKNL